MTTAASVASPPPQASSQPEEDKDDDDEYLVSCRCESARAVATLLSCLQHVAVEERKRSASSASMQPVTVFCSGGSLNFHVYGKSKQMQASVDMPASLFSDYDVCSTRQTANAEDADADDENNDDEWRAGGEFCVNLTTVLECLHVLGHHSLDQTKLFFSYNLTKDIFKLELLSAIDGALCTAAIPGLLPPHEQQDGDDDELSHSLALAFRSAPIAARVIVKSDALRGVLVPELESVQGAAECAVSLSARGGLAVRVVGNWGACQVSLPVRGAHVVSVELPKPKPPPPLRSTLAATNSSPPPQEWKYPLHALTESMRGLDIATETCITINTAGMMAIQHQVCDPTLSEAPNFIDFILCCLQDDNDESGDEAAEPNNNNKDDDNAEQQSTRTTPSLFMSQTNNDRVQTTTSLASGRSRVVSEKKGTNRGSDTDDGDDNHHHHDNDNDDDDDDASSRYPASDTRLFGSVASVAAASLSSSRNVRRRPRRLPQHQNTTSTTSNNNNNNNGFDSDEPDDADDEPPLDVTALASPPRRRPRHYRDGDDDDGECSSPELLYGPQN